MKISIGIVGGSIAGLSAAVSFLKKGFAVTIFERSKQALLNRGAGIGVSKDVLSKAQSQGILDETIPQLPCKTRSLLTKDIGLKNETKPLIKHQPFEMVALNWQHIYGQLYSRIPAQIYHLGESVVDVAQDALGVNLVTNQAHYRFDYVIGADGVNSKIRKKLYPDTNPNYANYVGWRGICIDPILTQDTDFDEHGALYFFKGGHLVIYKIPTLDYASTGKVALNWVLYETNPDQGVFPSTSLPISIPPGGLNDVQITHIQNLAKAKLPTKIARIVCATEQPFAQTIYDSVVPNHVNEKLILLGDSAACLRPHVAAGAVKAMEGAMSLAQAMDVPEEKRADSLISWNQSQIKETQNLLILSERFGKALVTDTPQWDQMDENDAKEWWTSVMTNQSWYATKKL